MRELEEAVSKAFPHLAYLVATLIIGNAVLTLFYPFILFFLDSQFRSLVLISNSEAVISFLLKGWIRLYTDFPVYAIFIGGFFVGFLIEAFSKSIVHFRSRLSKFRLISEQFEEEFMIPGTIEYAKFLIWLNKNPEQKGYWNWELFLWTVDARLFGLLLLFTASYAFFYIGYLIYQYFIGSVLSSISIMLGFLVISFSSIITIFLYYAFLERTRVFTTTYKVLYNESNVEKNGFFERPRAGSNVDESIRKKNMKTINKETTINDWTIKLAICQTSMEHEQSIRSGYQALLTAIEAAIFGLVFILIEYYRTDLWVLAVAGILLCLIFGTACEFRARNVDFWRRRIIELAKGTDLEDAFKRSKYGWIPFGRVGCLGEKFLGHWFERVLVPAIVVMWVWILIFRFSFLF